MPASDLERIFAALEDSGARYLVVGGVAVVLHGLWKGTRPARLVVLAFVSSALVMSAYWYPLWTAMPISHEWLVHHLWFRSWI